MGLGVEGLLFLSFTMVILLQDGCRHSLRLNLRKPMAMPCTISRVRLGLGRHYQQG